MNKARGTVLIQAYISTVTPVPRHAYKFSNDRNLRNEEETIKVSYHVPRKCC